MNKENIIDYVVQTPHNPNKKVLDDMLETLIEENGGGNTSVSEQIAEAIAKIPQNDWNQNDIAAKDYIKNRPFYEEGTIIVPKRTIDIPINTRTFEIQSDISIEEGQEYTIILDGEKYISIPFTEGEGDIVSRIDYNGTTIYISSTNSSFRKDLLFWTAGDVLPFAGKHTIVVALGDYNLYQIDPKYIKDMYYESEPVEVTVIEETIFELEDGMGQLTATQPLEVGQEYTVTLDGTAYNYAAKFHEEFGMPYIGNLGLIGEGKDTGESFLIAPMQSETELGIVFNSDVAEHTVSIVGMISEIHHIDPKYIKDMYYEYIAPNNDVVLDAEFYVEDDYQWLDPDDFSLDNFLVEGATYRVNCNDETYICTARRNNDDEIYIGNQAVCDDEWLFPEIIESNEPFYLYTFEENFDYGIKIQTADEYNIVIVGTGEKLTAKTIDYKYIPNNIKDSIRDQWDEIGNLCDKLYNSNFMSSYNPTGTGSFSMNRKSGTTIGEYSHAEGQETTASGEYSHAEGMDTTVATIDATAKTIPITIQGYASHAEGYGTVAYGAVSHAEGNGTKASGHYSHSEGYSTTASSYYSHAEGYKTTASGNTSHAEGELTKAAANHSHAEGSYTEANGIYSHAEGYYTTAASQIKVAKTTDDTSNGYASHAEGYGTVAYGAVSHAEGNGTTAYGKSTHAEGYNTRASGSYSHAEGYYTNADGECSHAEGRGTMTSEDYAHAEGYKTIASGTASHAEGYDTNASGQYQHAQGKYNIEDDESKYAHIVGNGTSDTKRSNAHTLDWEGNAWFAGSVEGTALILLSPNGTRFNITVGDDGVLSATKITE